MKLIIRTLFIAVMIMSSGIAYSAITPFHTRLYTPYGGTPVQVGQPEAYGEVFITGSADPYTDRFVRGVLTFGVDHHYPAALSSMRVKVELLVSRWSDATLGSADMLDTTIFLEISYSPNDSLSFTDKQSLMLSGVEKYSVTIQDVIVNGSTVTDLPVNLYLDADLYADRYFDFADNAETPVSILAEPGEDDLIDTDCDGTPDLLRISWPAMAGAEEYQLEWTYINDYGVASGTYIAAADLPFDFRRNSTRVSTSATSYDISLAFDHGYICYRVRAIGRDIADLNTRIFGVWSAPDAGNDLDVTEHFYQDWSYEGDKNWQYATTYAEEGKKKEVISFFDGSLRNRQMVTKVNSDENTIVGETIYDHQGRPAVQILPVPVSDPDCETPGKQNALKYYPEFNRNQDDEAYSRTDFDTSAAVDDTCTVATGSMKSTSGASSYYSSDNPDQTGHSAYIPDAQDRPFTQVEYTPDNTGRIRRQSGVGAGFELGSGHESKYWYSHPDQVPLDRMFGSEVGDASHYQKNMVMDPNGQVSVSYLDQEGRVIATSLAGNVPENLKNLPSSGGGVELTDDIFATDANGNTTSNKLSSNGTSKVFSAVMSVSADGDYTFDYGLIVDTLDDPCLADDICFGCVYDLTIQIYDECGTDLAEGEGLPKYAGRFDLTGEVLSFTTECSEEGSVYELPETNFTIPLSTGTYIVNKVLTVNEEAKNFYVEKYLDTNINTCLKTLTDFENEYLAATDFSDCEPSEGCAECVEALGTIEDFIANGLGTAAEYKLQRAACEAPCKQPSMCETYKNQMLGDLFPGGQYGEYQNPAGVTQPGIFPLSVFNEDNLLPRTNADWRYPFIVIDGTETGGYFEEDSITKSRVMLDEVIFDTDGTTILSTLPEVIDFSYVFQDAVTGQYYTFPETLAHLSDFIDRWENTWANSLLIYHPEYNFYKTCLGYIAKGAKDDAFSSETFDQLITRVETWDEAVTEGLIDASYASIPVVYDRITDWFSEGAHAWDPFVNYSSNYDNYGSMLSAKFYDYLTINGYHYSMPEVAAMMTRCGAQLAGGSPSILCARFGDDYGIDPVVNNEIRDEEWKRLRALYISAKQQLQQELAINRSINDVDYLGYNGCIGAEDFNPMEHGFFDPALISFPLNFLLSQFFNTSQPCNYLNYPLYKYKTKRFASPLDILPSNVNEIAYQQYLLTGQCPVTGNLQAFFADIAAAGKLAESSFAINDFNAFTGLALADNNYYLTNPIPASEWQQTTMTSTLLKANLVILPSTIVSKISLEIPAVTPVPYTWTDILSFSNLRFTSESGDYYFEIIALIDTTGGTMTDTLTGHTTTDIENCRFNEICHPNDLGVQLLPLLSSLAYTGELIKTIPVQILGGGSQYEPVVTPVVQQFIHPGAITTAYWQYDAVNHAFLSYESSSSERLELKINSMEPAAFSWADLEQIGSFSALVPTQSNSFDLVATNFSGDYLVTLKCDAIYWDGAEKTQIPVGDCDQPASASCEGAAFDNTKNLGKVLRDVLNNQAFDPVDGYDITASIYYTSELILLTGGTTNPTTSETESDVVEGVFMESTSIFNDQMCKLTLRHHDNNAPALALEDLVSVSNFTPMGERDEWGNYHDFYLLATYEVDSETYEDTIFGNTCIPLNICVLCAPSATLFDIEPFAAVPSTCEALYDRYLDGYLYFQTQQQEDLTCADYPVEIPLLTLQDFIDSNICCNPDHFGDVMEDFIYQFDQETPCPETPLPSYASCDTTYNPADYPCRETYRAFLELLDAYNYSPWAIANSAFLDYNAFGSASEFYASGKCYCIPYYTSYLEDYITAGAMDVLPTPVAVKDFAGCALSVPESPDTCAYLYNQYLLAYSGFQQHQLADSTCADYQTLIPPLTYQDFIDNNVCCSFDNMLATVPFIIQFTLPTPCPEDALPLYASCENPEPEANPCGEKFYAFLLKLEEYNNSPWAQANHSFLSFHAFDGYEGFELRCACADDYFSYLDIYINADPGDLLNAPYSLSSMESCTAQIPACDLAFEQYNACISDFNVWANEHSYDLAAKVNKETFLSEDFCGCADAYCAYLNNVKDGFVSQEDYEENPGIATLCDDHTPQPCAPEAPLGEGGELPTDVFIDPCTEFLTNTALSNASAAYDAYLDSVKNYIASRYITHCMGAAETFTKTYFDNEYHRTLYYYDQAGNLIKTVPPEGVELLDITSFDDPHELLVKQDRLYGTHNILTSHRLATTYVYNSLNQLIRQSTPDQDQMEIWEITQPNGLQAGLNVTAIQMVNANRGYLTGTVNISGTTRGFLYRTDNGGTNWTKVDNTVAADLKTIRFSGTSTTGYAIGENGVILKTVNGGSSWDMLNTYAYGATFDLYDIKIYSASTVAFVGKSDQSLFTTDGGSTFTVTTGVLPSGTPGTLETVKVANSDSDGAFFVVNMEDGSQRYDGIWHYQNDFMEPIKAKDYFSIHGRDGDHAVANSKDLQVRLETPASGTDFKQTTISSENRHLINESYFLNADRGIMNDNGELYYTADGGTHWQAVGQNIGSGFLNLLNQSTTVLELLAVSDHAKSYRIVFSATASPQVIDQTSYLTVLPVDLKSAADYSESPGKRIMTGAGDGKIYFSSLITTGFEPLQYHEIGQLNGSDPSEYARKIVLYNFTGGVVSGVILSSENSLYAIHRSSASSAFVITNLFTGFGTPDFGDILLDESDQKVFGFDNGTGKLHKMQLSSGAAVVSSSSSTLTLGLSVSGMAQNHGRITVVGDGEIYTSNDVSGSNALTVWDERSGLRVSHSINDMADMGSDVFTMAGENGFTATRSGTGTSAEWEIHMAPVFSDIQGIATNGTNLVMVGTAGFVYQYDFSLPASFYGQLSNGQPTAGYFAGVDFKDVVMDGNKVYICGTNSTVLNTTDITNENYHFTSGNFPGVDFSGISFYGGYNLAYAVGNDSRAYRFVDLTGTQVKSVFNAQLSDVHFSDVNHGTIAGSGFFVRQTNNGGTSWEMVLPGNDVSTQLGADIRRVWTVGDNYALMVGDDYLASIKDNVSTRETAAGTPDFHAIQFGSDPLNGFVAAGGSVQRIALTPSGGGYTVALGTSYTPASTPAELRALHVFENGNVMAVGTDSYTGYLTFPAGTFDDYVPAGTTEIYNDVFFHDDVTGYVVGDAGLVYRTQNVSIDDVTHAVTALDWEQQNVLDAQVTTASDVDIAAIAFSGLNTGTWGGSATFGYGLYVRNIRDESGDFSTRFYYDRLGRLVVSQNARQYAGGLFSYSLYDALGRVYEAGEKAENTTDYFFAGIFGTEVGGQYIATVIDDQKLSDWLALGDGSRKQVTRSYYDASVITGLPADFVPDAGTQRKRITHVTYEAVYDGDDQTYDHATHYDYDIHGNVKTLLQDNSLMAADPLLENNRFKRMDYNYDLISGNVHRVSYQFGRPDQWHHAYTYDADNRITQAYTTTTTPVTDPNLGQTASENEPELTPYWDREAEYFYYAHGPLARTELGEEKVQGMDYVYTVQGWMKGVNSNALDATRDPGKDGNSNNTGRDAYGYSLHYYAGDYADIAGISAADHPYAAQTGSDLTANSDDLFNGNIGRMVTTITNPTTRDILPLGNAYKYDQLNRLSESRSFSTINLSTNAWNSATTYNNKYFNAFEYDANGNILTQNRYDDAGTQIEELSYKYKLDADGKLVQNRLYHVNDGIGAGTATGDIDDMGTFDGDPNDINLNNNYSYDADGRLVSDVQEEIKNIVWRVDGKVLKINRPDGSTKKNLIFEYDAMGNRIAKHVLTSDNVLEKSTYYVLDAQGNTMSVYERVVDEEAESVAFYQAEKHIYGSSRLGMINDSISLLGSENDTTYSMTLVDHVTGKRNYELNNHLGNVLSVVSDKPVPVDDDTDGDVDWYLADIRLSKDYSPFGVTLAGRNYEQLSCENVMVDSVVELTHYEDLDTATVIPPQWFKTSTATYWASGGEIHLKKTDPGVALLSVDRRNISITPGNRYRISTNLAADAGITDVRLVAIGLGAIDDTILGTISTTGQEVSFDISFPATGEGNKLWVLIDAVFHDNVQTLSVDYLKVERLDSVEVEQCGGVNGAGGEYRYGFNGMERDDEVKGDGNSYDFGARMMDARLGRWLSIDPLAGKYPGLTPYQFSFNCPTIFKDPDGKDGILTVDKGNHTVTMETTVYLYGVDPAGGSQLAKYYNETYSALCNHQKVKDPNDPNIIWTVNFNVNYVYEPDVAKMLEQQIGPEFTYHVGLSEGANGLRRAVHRSGNTAQGGNKGYAGGEAALSIHETFHMLGFDERYAGGPIEFYKSDILSAGYNPERPIEIMTFHFVDLLDFALSELPDGGRKVEMSRPKGVGVQVNIPIYHPVTGVQMGGETKFVSEPEKFFKVDNTGKGNLKIKDEKNDQQKMDERIVK